MGIGFAGLAGLGKPLLATGAVVLLAASAWLFVVEERRAGRSRGSAASRAPALPGRWLAALGVVLAVAALLRLTGLAAKGISHPEAYIPGLALPPGISEPPPRHGFVETASWHFFSEPHPFGYYLAMWAWTRVFGASLLSIRMPEALLGTLSVYLVYRVGRGVYGARVGVVAAALLALHGFHVFWSQTARMYAPGAFLGLLSTALLLEATRGERLRPGVEAAYVATSVAGAMTVEFFWPFLAAQMLWTALRHPGPAWPPPRAARVQAFAFVLAAPMLSHALMLGRNEAAPPPSLRFLSEYLSFGFLYQHGAYGGMAKLLPPVLSLPLLLLALGLIGRGLVAGPDETPPERLPPPPAPGPLRLAALGSAAVMLGIALVAARRQATLAVLSGLPLLVLLAPRIAGALRPGLARLAPGLERRLAPGGSAGGLVGLLALGPALGLFATSFVLTLTAPRAFLQFVPYVVLLVAAGAWSLARRPVVAAALATALGVAFAGSALVLRRVPTSTRDYQGLARALEARLEPGDRIFTPPRHWAYTPLFYYLDPGRLVGGDYAEALQRDPRARVWVLTIPPQDPPGPEMVRALAGYRIADRIEVRQAGALLYVPPR